MAPPDVETRFIEASDGTRLAVHELGEGRPLLLIHGYFSNARINWLRYGHAARLAERGLRVILPDLRAHGDSGKPHDPDAYPPDVLMRDGLELIEQLGLTDYDLAGYSLGGRSAVRMVVNGARPRRLAVCGMGLEGLLDTAGRGRYFEHVLTHLGSFAHGTPEWLTEAFLKTSKGDPQALLQVLHTFVDTPRAALARISMPTLVVCGSEDFDNGSAQALAEALPAGRYHPIPGNHMSAVAKPELGLALADFFSD